MDLYLIRHAHAVDAEEDPARPLSDRGRKQVRVVTNFLDQSEAFEPAEIWHSALARSRETAQMLAHALARDAVLTSTPGLEPNDDPDAIVRRLKKFDRALAIVGHEPHLSALATLLVAGPDKTPLFLLKKCSVLRLEGTGAHWQVRWQVSPELLP